MKTAPTKYPRTLHLPWSAGVTSDDKLMKSCDMFERQRVIVSEKMDGENFSIYKDYVHARSVDGKDHWSRSWVKKLQAEIGHQMPDGWRFCGENLYAKHSIGYKNLNSYFYLFSVWDEGNTCLGWDTTMEYAQLLGLETVPVLYDGIWDEDLIKELYTEDKRDVMEGYVVRLASSFHYREFSSSVAKFVRSNHVNPDDRHWFFTATEKNELQKG